MTLTSPENSGLEFELKPIINKATPEIENKDLASAILAESVNYLDEVMSYETMQAMMQQNYPGRYSVQQITVTMLQLTKCGLLNQSENKYRLSDYLKHYLE